MLLIFCCSLNCNSQDITNSISGIRVDKNYYQGINNIGLIYFGFVDSFHLNDSVKSVTTYFSKIETKNNELNSKINLKIYPFIEFDKFGNLISLIQTGGLNYNIYKDIESIERLKQIKYTTRGIRKFNYYTDEKDRVEKSKYYLKKNTPYPAFDGNKIKLNTYTLFQKDSMDNKYMLSNDKYLISYAKYKYVYNTNGTINNEMKLMFSLKVNDTNWKKEVDSISMNFKNPTYYKTNYSYDNDAKLICQDVEFNYSKTSSYTDESPFLDGLLSDGAEINYYYDEKERLNEVIFTYPRRKLYQTQNYLTEKYFYDSTKNYIYKVIRNQYDKGSCNTEFNYNSFGDVIKVTYVAENSNNQKYMEKNQVYEYEYDKNNNWIKCKIFFEGTNQTEPNFIVERKIEYYSE